MVEYKGWLVSIGNSAGYSRVSAGLAVLTTCILMISSSTACGSETGPGIPLNGWSNRLPTDQLAEDDARLNGMADGGVLYSRRLANMAAYTNSSHPVAGFYGHGYGAIIDPDSPPVYYVDSKMQRRQKVVWMTGQGPASLEMANGLQQKFLDVPVPTGPAGENFESFYGRPITGGGPDQQLTLYDRGTHEMWEMWRFEFNGETGTYEMGYGGYSTDVREESIAFADQWGARATSLPLAAGIMLQDEYLSGEFRHPLTISVPVVKSGYLPPATREDENLPANTVGGDARDGVPEGAWFRLPSEYQIDASKPKLYQMMVKAARDYGVVVADGSGGSLTFYAEGDNAVGTPFSPLRVPAFPPAEKEGPYFGKENILNDFPWDRLVQIKYAP